MLSSPAVSVLEKTIVGGSTPAQKEYILRVIAFESETSCQFTFDLNFNDLLILMHGNIKLLEEESSHDMCQTILNSLTIIKREKVDSKG